MPDNFAIAAITFVTSVVTAYVVARLQAKHDLKAWERSRRSVVSDTAANMLRDTVIAISTASHAACWLTWKAKYAADELTPSDLVRYDELLHKELPKILGGQAAIATLCPVAAEKVAESVKIICAEDDQIGHACIAHRKGNKVALAERHDDALNAYNAARELCSGLGAQLMAAGEERLARS
jgi:hypothetical protein